MRSFVVLCVLSAASLLGCASSEAVSSAPTDTKPESTPSVSSTATAAAPAKEADTPAGGAGAAPSATANAESPGGEAKRDASPTTQMAVGGLVGPGGQGFGAASGLGERGGGGQSRGKVQAATATATGTGLAPDVISRVIRENVGRIHLCYEAAMAKTPSLAGKIVVAFTINGQGVVASASAGETTIADGEMVNCVVKVLKSIAFPAPDGGSNVQVSYPFVFSSDP